MSEVTKIATRVSYGNALVELAKEHDDVYVLDADLAAATQTAIFRKEFPERHIDCGFAECNMIGIAAGLAATGKVPFASSFAMFAAGRAFEQVRNSVGYPHLNVKIGATHAGISVGEDGATHQCNEDIALMRTIPGMVILNTSDDIEAKAAVKAAYENFGPYYIRINRGFDRTLYGKDYPREYKFEVGKAIEVNPGTDITVIACGSCVFQAYQAAKFLEEADGLKVRVLDMHTIKPIDKEAVLKAVMDTRRIITVEDHTVLGGLGGAVAEVMAEAGKGCAFTRLGLQDKFAPIGLHEDIMSMLGIDCNGIIAAVREAMNKDFEEDDNWDDDV